MIDTGAAEVVRDLAQAATEPSELELGKYHAWLAPNGQLHKVDLTGDEWRDFPRRKTGIVTVRNVASFKTYYDRHNDGDSEVFADLDEGTVTAVLDAHRGHIPELEDELAAGEGARWQQHRLILGLTLTEAWKDWTSHDRQWMPQENFAEWLEDHASHIHPGRNVTAADLLEAAQTFQAKLKVSFTSGKRLKDGQTQFEYMETIESAGRPTGTDRGTIEMPNEFDLAIQPYEDAATEPIAVRLRFRIRENKTLVLGYFMNEPARVAREAVASVVEKLAAECSVTVMYGQPA